MEFDLFGCKSRADTKIRKEIIGNDLIETQSIDLDIRKG